MRQRLQKLISVRGVASRRAAEEMILKGRITVNGKIATLGDSADPDTDEILLDGSCLPSSGKPVYILLNKPKGYVTTLSDEKGRKNAAQLVADCGVRVYPVGRLDMDSEGLLLFTNDGEFANRLMHPSHEVVKIYHVWVKGFRQEALAALKKSVCLDGYRIKPPEVQVLDQKDPERVKLQVSIHEGRNRQVRRMCAIAGMKVLRLVRVQEGSLHLGDLPSGAWRYLTEKEIAEL